MHEPMRMNGAMESLGELGAGARAGAEGGAVAGRGKGLLAAFSITEKKGLDKPLWSRVGSAFFNRDGSINVYLDALPLQGKLQLREERDRPSAPKSSRHAPAGEES